MKICQEHWDMLRDKIKEHGLDSLVAENGEQAMDQFARASQGEDTIDTFDPLMYAYWQIIQHGVELIGGRALAIGGYDLWITLAADASKGHLEWLNAQ